MRCCTIGIAALALAFGGVASAASEPLPAEVTAAVADAARPAADRARDADRHPAELVAFAGLERGDRVVDFLPGGGYFTRIFSKVVGPSGHVYALVASERLATRPQSADGVKAIAADKTYGNVTVLAQPVAALKVDQPVDLVWTSNNYHDLKNKGFGPADTAAMNRAIFAALKPGGSFIVIDHKADPGAVDATEKLHRIDPEVVKREVLAAGFEFAGESAILHNPADDHTASVMENRGKSDQFVYKFTKPRRR